MRQAYVFEGIAVLVGPWHEPMTPPERGTRVEVRLLDDEPKRGSRFAAERVVVDRPVFRADLFDQTDHPPGNLRAAHFHPGFDGIEPLDRHWDEAIQARPDRLARRASWATCRACSSVRASRSSMQPWLDADTAALRDGGADDRRRRRSHLGRGPRRLTP